MNKRQQIIEDGRKFNRELMNILEPFEKKLNKLSEKFSQHYFYEQIMKTEKEIIEKQSDKIEGLKAEITKLKKENTLLLKNKCYVRYAHCPKEIK